VARGQFKPAILECWGAALHIRAHFSSTLLRKA
jgi:hypothetical protein